MLTDKSGVELKPIKISRDVHLALWREYTGIRQNKQGTLQEFSTKIIHIGLRQFMKKEPLEQFIEKEPL